ncbi:MAG: hypothetical protein PVJ55_05810 [Anaerolineae bacterium]|jgi:hypothetical protein
MLRSLGACVLITALSVFSACNSPASPSPEAQGRTLPPTVGIELSPGTVVSRPATLDSLKEAQELVSFPVLVPDPETLPAGLEVERVEWRPDPERGMEMVAISYRDASSGTDLHIRQIDLARGTPHRAPGPASREDRAPRHHGLSPIL